MSVSFYAHNTNNFESIVIDNKKVINYKLIEVTGFEPELCKELNWSNHNTRCVFSYINKFCPDSAFNANESCLHGIIKINNFIELVESSLDKLNKHYSFQECFMDINELFERLILLKKFLETAKNSGANLISWS